MKHFSGARQELGLLAAGVTATFNAQHKLGLDLTGTAGGNFFAPIAPVAASDYQNTGTSVASVAITVISVRGPAHRLQAVLQRHGQWQLTNQKSGEIK